MASYYWIKLYHEILDDPKMALLPDRLWRRVVELFLLAGKHGKDGNLPGSRQIAWELRQVSDDIDLDLIQIESTGIIERTSTGWKVVNFEKRQAASSNTERSHEYRKRKPNNDATKMQRNVAQINRLTEAETESESEAEKKTEAKPAPSSSPSFNSVDYNNFQTGISQKCERLYQAITGQVSIPAASKEIAMRNLEDVLDYYKGDIEAAKAPGMRVFLKWCNTQSPKTGRMYSRTNPAWVEQWLGQLAPEPQKAPALPGQKSDAELRAYAKSMGL